MTSFLKIYGSLHGESWWTSCKSFSCRACCSFLAVCIECKEPKVSRPMGCCRTKNARSYSHVHTFGAGCFQIAHETKRHTHTHPQHHMPIIFLHKDMLGSRCDSCTCFCHSGERVRRLGQIRLRVLGCTMVQPPFLP